MNRADLLQPARPEDTWPSVDLAYEFVRPSYEWIMRRLEVVDGRIQTLVAFAASFTVATPVFARSLLPELGISIWLILALLAFLAMIIIGLVSRAMGNVRLVNPRHLYDRWLDYSPWEFKKNMIYWAGQDFETNRSLVDNKGWLANLITLLFVLELVFLFLWTLQR